MTEAKGQYLPLPLACHRVECTVQPAGTSQPPGVPGVTVWAVLVAAQPAHWLKLKRFFHIQYMELPSDDHKLEGREDGRGRWSLRGKGSETPGAESKGREAAPQQHREVRKGSVCRAQAWGCEDGVLWVAYTCTCVGVWLVVGGCRCGRP